MIDVFDKLNTEQIEAVTETEGFVRIIAGAGSGKTKTLTHRYAYLVKAAGIHPGNVLCVTFTNKAAGEMKRRVRSIVGEGCDTSLITTYHGFCVRVLREDIGRLFYPQSFPILDEFDQRRILEEIYTELQIKLDRASFEKILDEIHKVKSQERYVDCFVRGDFSSLPDSTLEERIIRMYMQKQKKTFGLDFDDLICFTFEIFSHYPEVLEKWRERLHYIQVDEFQDSSKRELRLISMLSSVHRNLFVVGDPDQNIYEWRGADMSILVDFDKTFPDTKTIILNRNYRSTGNILRAANTLIGKNKNRIKKDLYTEDGNGADVIHLHAKTEHDEGKYIADEIKRLVASGMHYRDVAVLYRSSFLSRFIEQALMAANVPYELFGSVRFYDRMEIRDALSYLRLIAYNDNQALERVINTPKRMFGKTKLAKLRELAEADGISYYEALVKYIELPVFSRSGARAFVDMIERLRQNYTSMPLTDIIESVLSESGYEQYIRENGSMERLDNLAEFKRTAVTAEQGYGEFYPLEDFLGQAALQAENDEKEENSDRVKLMTIHASKGLEFPVCFVCGFTEGIFPSGRTLEERKDEGLEEERRLCFVAMTRAMRNLYLTESEGSSQFSGGTSNKQKRPSRFIFEIGEGNYRRIGIIPKELENDAKKLCSDDLAAPEKLSIGSRVEHPIFGSGTIQSIDGERQIYQILFDKSNSVKPVDMDYDFEKWKNLAEMRKKALERARSDSKAASESDVPLIEVDAPAPSSAAPENAFQSSERLPELPYAKESDTEETSKGGKKSDADEIEQLSLEFEAPENADGESIDMTADISESTDNDDNDGNTDNHENAGSAKKASGTPSKPLMKPTELPEKYRNAEWMRTIDEGEENLWKRPDVPHSGWRCEAVYDLGEPVGTCRMCGHQIIRYVHVMVHPEYPRKIGAGCVCAGKMEGDPEAARTREAEFKKSQKRLSTFLSIKPKRSRNGNEYIKYHDEIITIIADKFKPGNFKAVWRNTYTMSYPSRELALREVFERIDAEK